MKILLGMLVARKDLIIKFLDKEFPARTSIKFKILSHEIAKYTDIYEQQRVELVKKYGAEIDGQIRVDPNSDKWNAFVKELTDVANQEVEVVFPTINEEELLVDPELKITAHELLDFEVFYEKEEIPEVIAN
jgi:hypothetical protein